MLQVVRLSTGTKSCFRDPNEIRIWLLNNSWIKVDDNYELMLTYLRFFYLEVYDFMKKQMAVCQRQTTDNTIYASINEHICLVPYVERVGSPGVVYKTLCLGCQTTMGTWEKMTLLR